MLLTYKISLELVFYSTESPNSFFSPDGAHVDSLLKLVSHNRGPTQGGRLVHGSQRSRETGDGHDGLHGS